jgi:hypothetical protein
VSGLPPGRGKDLPVDQARQMLLRQLARVIETTMPGNTGFVLLVYGQGPLAAKGELLQYVSNSERLDVIQLLKEWLANMANEREYARDIPPGATENEVAFDAWWAERLARSGSQAGFTGLLGESWVQEWCQDAWNAGRASKV